MLRRTASPFLSLFAIPHDLAMRAFVTAVFDLDQIRL